MTWLLILALVGCKNDADTADTAPAPVPWSGELPDLADEVGTTRGLVPKRSIIHLHSPYSHDACDGEGWVAGVVDLECVADLRRGLCESRIDVAFITDHPDHASSQTWEQWLLAEPGDTPIERGSTVIGNTIHCDNGHAVSYYPGIEDELMPVALDEHVDADTDERHRLYNNDDQEAIDALRAVGGTVLVAHIEGRELTRLQTQQDQGLTGIEAFNLHAMFAPDIRQEFLGLEPYQWLIDAEPFISEDGTAEPDLLFLAVLQHQDPTLATWDALLARGAAVGVGGTDAHRNSIPLILRDGDRGDSYRRMFRWFSNVLLVDGEGPDAAEQALAAGRSYLAFHALGIPVGFDFALEAADGTFYEMGSEAPLGTLHVGCPGLSATSPNDLSADPEITTTVLRDGVVWQTECGSFDVDSPGVYRVQIEQIPRHLTAALGDDPAPWLKAYPWVYGNAIRIGL